MKKGKDYIIFPLDVSIYEDAMRYVEILSESVGLFKVGLELFISQGPGVLKGIRERTDAGIFLDLKLHDIPVTVQRAFIAACRYRPQFVTVHCDEGGRIFGEAAGENPAGTKILAVTVLTSLDQKKLKALGYEERFINDPLSLVLLRARIAMEAGCHGIVCSGREVSAVKKELGKNLIAVTPGIRPAWSLVKKDDQKRIVTPSEAVKNGADYIVVGRPIRDAENPVEAAKRIGDEIQSVIDCHVVGPTTV